MGIFQNVKKRAVRAFGGPTLRFLPFGQVIGRNKDDRANRDAGKDG